MDYAVDKRTAVFERLMPGNRYNISVKSGINKKKSKAVFKVTNTSEYISLTQLLPMYNILYYLF